MNLTTSIEAKEINNVDLLASLGLTKEGLESQTRFAEIFEKTGNKLQIEEHQLKTIFWLLYKRRTFCAENMGLGKTLSALLAFSQLKKWKIANRAMFVIDSKNGLASILADIKKLTYLTSLRGNSDVGVDLGGIDVVVYTYKAASLLCTSEGHINSSGVEFLKNTFDVFIMDEAHSIKSPEAIRTRGLYHLLHPSTNPNAAAVWMMSGTPTSDKVLDMWSQFYILDGGATLGTSLENFIAYFCDKKEVLVKGRKKTLKVPTYETRLDRFEELIRRTTRNCIIYDTDEVADLPSFKFHINFYSLAGDALIAYNESAKNNRRIRNGDEGNDIHRSKFLQIASGFLYIGEGAERFSGFFKSREKAVVVLDTIHSLLTKNPTKVSLLFYYLEGSAVVLEEELKCRGMEYVHLGSGRSAKTVAEELKYIDNHKGGLTILANLASCGKSMNLQRSDNAHYYDVPNGVIMLVQSLHRIRRLGSKSKKLDVYLYPGYNTVESRMYQNLAKGKSIVNALYTIESLKKIGSIGRSLTPSSFETLLNKKKDRKTEISDLVSKLKKVLIKQARGGVYDGGPDTEISNISRDSSQP